jgi:hypothetical protein
MAAVRQTGQRGTNLFDPIPGAHLKGLEHLVVLEELREILGVLGECAVFVPEVARQALCLREYVLKFGFEKGAEIA